MTFTLIAIDRQTGEIGATSASMWPALGSVLPRFRPGVGLVVTQHYAHLMMAETMLSELEQRHGLEHPGHLATSISSFVPSSRQYGYATLDGHLFGWTGDACEPVNGHFADDDCVAIGNMLANDRVLPAMVERFSSTSGPLCDRLLSALMAGDAMGGDRRGRLSAFVQVWAPTYPDVDECPIDFRVDLHDRPVQALTEILTEYRAQPRPMPWQPSVKLPPLDSATKNRPESQD